MMENYFYLHFKDKQKRIKAYFIASCRKMNG